MRGTEMTRGKNTWDNDNDDTTYAMVYDERYREMTRERKTIGQPTVESDT